MMVLVDTPVWSLALRRQPVQLNDSEQILTRTLAELVREGRAQMLGPIRQELLSGIRAETQFKKLCEYLRAFREPLIEPEDYEDAGRMSNHCRAKGIAGSAVDFLICAVAHRREWMIFTTDRDFQRYGLVLPVRLHAAPLGN
jgi:predicted nucleic acid-binding protein